MPTPRSDSCGRFEELVELWLDDCLSPEEAKELEAELENSASAQGYVAEALVFSEQIGTQVCGGKAPGDSASQEFPELVDLWLDDRLSSKELNALEAELEKSDSARKHLADALVFSEQIGMELSSGIYGKRASAAQGDRKLKPAIMLAALGGAFAIAAVFSWKLLFPTPPGPDWVAFIDRVEDAQWALPGEGKGYDSEVAYEERLELEAGFAGITLADGSRVLLEGPCSATLHENRQLTLHSGKLVLSLPQGSGAFSIESAGYQIKVAANSTGEDEGNLYGLHYDEANNELQTSVYSGNVQVSPLGTGKPASYRQIPISNTAPMAKSFQLAFKPTAGRSAFRWPIQLEKAEGAFNQIIDLSAAVDILGAGKYGLHSVLDSGSIQPASIELLMEGQKPRFIDNGVFELSDADVSLAPKLRISWNHDLSGSTFVFLHDEACRRSDFLGVWKVTAPHADANQFAVVRLRVDGSLILESGKIGPYTGKPYNWYFRGGTVSIRDSKGHIVDEWRLLDRGHLASKNDGTLLIVRQ